MSVRIRHAATRAAVRAATSQQAQCEALRDAFSGNVTVRIYGAGLQHLRTVTLPPLGINTSVPRGLTCGAFLADTAVAPTTPGSAAITPVLWEFRDGSTVIFDTDAITQGGIKALCTPTFNGVVFTADPNLPSVPVPARISIGGQSNALGFASSGGDLNTSPLNSDPGLYTQYLADFDRVFIWNPSSGAYEKLRYGVNQQAIGSGNIGPEFGFAIRWMREVPAGNLYIDKHGEGGQPISYFQSGGAFFTEAESRRAAQNSWLSTNGISPTELSWLWDQGQSNSADTESSYRSALDTLIADRLSAGLMTAGALRVLVQILPTGALYGPGVAAAKAAYVADNPATGRIVNESIHMDADNIHRNCRGQLQAGYDWFSVVTGYPTITV